MAIASDHPGSGNDKCLPLPGPNRGSVPTNGARCRCTAGSTSAMILWALSGTASSYCAKARRPITRFHPSIASSRRK
jgi:hypothetical protein